MRTNLKISAAKKAERDDFIQAYNPDLQRKICHDADLCFFGRFPTLATIARLYGPAAPAMWLVTQIVNLSEYCGCKDKITPPQTKECATIIARQYHYLKISELMLFFYRFKEGRYGRFYGAVDPLVITTALQEFARERNIACEQHEKEQNARIYAESIKNAVTYEQYKAQANNEHTAKS